MKLRNCVFAILIILVLAACFNPLEEKASYITINLGENSGRAAVYPPTAEIKALLVHKVKVASPNGNAAANVELSAGEFKATIKLDPGTYTVTVDAYHEGVHYATGSADAEIKAGIRTQLGIKMSHVTPEPEPEPGSYTISFDSVGGSGVNVQTITEGGMVSRPEDPVYAGYTFDGWYRDAGYTTLWDFANNTVTENITLYAKWASVAVTAINISPAEVNVARSGKQQFIAAVDYSDGTSGSGSGDITWTVTGAETGITIDENGLLSIPDGVAAGATFNVKAVANAGGIESNTAVVTIITPVPNEARRTRDNKMYATLAEAIADSAGTANVPEEISILTDIPAASANYTIPSDTHVQLVVETGNDFAITEPTADGDMFTVDGGTLILGSGDPAGGKLTLQGTNNRSVLIKNGGTLTVNDNVTIKDFNAPVNVGQNSYFTMRGGRIENNKGNDDAGGVLAYRGTFRMEGGFIANNQGDIGGGVAATYGGTFIFQGGTIYGSDAPEFTNFGDYGNALGIFGSGNTAIYDDGTPILTGGATGIDTTMTRSPSAGNAIGTLEQSSGGVYTVVSGITDLASVINAVNNTPGEYRLTVNVDIPDAAPQTAFSNGTKLTIMGDGATRTITLNADGSLFTVGDGAELTLDSGITLDGNDKNNSAPTPLVSVTGAGSKLVMNSGSKITKNGERGVYLGENAEFTMNDGEISENKGGGVGVGGNNDFDSTDTYTMINGVIKNNSGGTGGGVYVGRSGRFYMQGGFIEGNQANDPYYGGGGVYTSMGGRFEMSGGEIRNNYTAADGGGVCEYWGTFVKTGGTIYGSDAADGLKNTAAGDGHTVYNDLNTVRTIDTTLGPTDTM